MSTHRWLVLGDVAALSSLPDNELRWLGQHEQRAGGRQLCGTANVGHNLLESGLLHSAICDLSSTSVRSQRIATAQHLSCLRAILQDVHKDIPNFVTRILSLKWLMLSMYYKHFYSFLFISIHFYSFLFISKNPMRTSLARSTVRPIYDAICAKFVPELCMAVLSVPHSCWKHFLPQFFRGLALIPFSIGKIR